MTDKIQDAVEKLKAKLSEAAEVYRKDKEVREWRPPPFAFRVSRAIAAADVRADSRLARNAGPKGTSSPPALARDVYFRRLIRLGTARMQPSLRSWSVTSKSPLSNTTLTTL
jgi:hypothetical protein